MEPVSPYLHIDGLSKTYQDIPVLKESALQLEKGECLAILGPSGHGKSTLLKCIAGLEEADQGSIIVRGQELSRKPTRDRNIVYLQQNTLLFPHMTVGQNISFGLKARKLNETTIEKKVDHWLRLTGLQKHKSKKPNQLSGGQQQRVAMARALIIEPDVVLLDEPFHALDQMLKKKLYKEVQDLFEQLDITSILVTHDVREAMIWGDQLAWMENKKLMIYEDQAAFIEDPRTGVKDVVKFWKNLDYEGRFQSH
jgi:putrescine transport system ATP-binding protein